MSGLQREDYESIDRASQTLFERGWRTRFSLNGMMDAWRGLVEDIEAGYSEMLDEYTNDACCRKWLDEAWPLLTPAVRAARQPELDALDDRFRAATEEISVPLMKWDDWWWRQVPLRRSGDFAEEVARLGI